jgi:hypothetical protein
MDPDLLLFSLTFKMPTKNYLFKQFFCLLLLKVHLHHFSKIKSPKEVTKQKKSRVFLLVLLADRRIRIRVHTFDIESGSGSGSPKTSGSNGSESRFGSGSGTLVEAYFYIVHLSLPVTRYSLLGSRIHGRTISLR